MRLEFESFDFIEAKYCIEWFNSLPSKQLLSTALSVSLSDIPNSLLRTLLPSYFPSLVQLNLSVQGGSPVSPTIHLPPSLKHCYIHCYNQQLFVIPSTIEILRCGSLHSLSFCRFTPQKRFFPELKCFSWDSIDLTHIVSPPTISAPHLESIQFDWSPDLAFCPITVPFLCSNLQHITIADVQDDATLCSFHLIPEHSVASVRSFYVSGDSLFGGIESVYNLSYLNNELTQWSSTLAVFSSLKIISFTIKKKYNRTMMRISGFEAFCEFCLKEKNKFPALEYVGETEFNIGQDHYSSQSSFDLEQKIENFLQQPKQEPLIEYKDDEDQRREILFRYLDDFLPLLD